jgi:beta-1,4-mannosyltransferase
MRILAHPARRNRHRNPFNFLLSEAVAAQGCEVVDFDNRNGFVGSADVVHIHWPQEAARGRLRRAMAKAVGLVLPLLLHRLRGARIVWTVHNVRGHDQNNPALERVLMWIVASMVHGVIFLTASTRAHAYKEIPKLASKPFAVIPHGLYGTQSERTQAQARVLFGLSVRGRVIGFLGDIKRYKGLDLLIAAFEQTPPGAITLFVAGVFTSRSYGACVRERLGRLCERGNLVAFRETRLDNRALVDAIRACDVVVLPYDEIWNSGLALLVLENGVPILTSDAPVFRDLQHEVGPDWVQVFDGELTGEILAAVAGKATEESCETICAFAAERSWPRIGADTVSFYRRLGAA